MRMTRSIDRRRIPVLAGLLLVAALGPGQPEAADAYEILAALETQPGNSFSGPRDRANGFSDLSTEVSVTFSQGFPDNGEIIGRASVRLGDGTLRGSAHTVAKAFNTARELRFVSRLEEVIEVTFPAGLPISERFVTLHSHLTAAAVANGPAIASGIFSLQAQNSNLRAAVAFDEDSFDVIDDGLCVVNGPCVTIDPGGHHFSIRVAPSSGLVFIEAQLEGTARAFGGTIFNPGPGIADVIADNTAQLALDLPPGTTFTSSSGVFLTEQAPPGPVPMPPTGALVVLGVGLASFVGAFRRRVMTMRSR